MNRQFRRFRRWFALLIIIVVAFALPVYFTGRWIDYHSRIFVNELERAVIALEKAHIDPNAALLQAQTHLAAARLELNTLQPVADVATGSANQMTTWPGVGPPARQLVAMWTFAESTTTLAENLVGAAQIGQVNFETNGVEGVIVALPTIQTNLQAAQTVLTQAQTAREQLEPAGQPNLLTLLPADQKTKLKTALTRWDALAPTLAEILDETNHLLADVDVVQVRTDLQTLVTELEQISAIIENSPDEPLEAVEESRKHLEKVQVVFDSLRPAVTPLLNRTDRLAALLAETPFQENEIADFPHQIAAWWRFTEATMLLGNNLISALELGLLNVDQAGVDGALAATSVIQEHLQDAQSNLAQAQSSRAELETPDWLPPDMTTKLDNALTTWDAATPILEKAVPQAESLARISPLLLGSETPVTYLLMVQSSTELRPSGGFLGSIGVVTVADGKITEVDLREVVELDHPWEAYSAEEWPGRIPPPFGLQRYMGMRHWFLRDGNWWADFPGAARQVRDLWALEHDTEIDGVMAITDRGVLRLLEAVGPVETLSGDVVSAETGMAFAAKQIYQRDRSDGIHPQTQLLQEMGLIFVVLTRDFSSTKLIDLAQFFQEAIPRKDFLITSFDPPLAYELNKLGVDGALGGQQDDYIYLVESNVSVNKSSQFIRQNLNYEVTLAPDGRPNLATLTINEVNTFRPEDKIPGFPENSFNGVVWPFTSPNRAERLRPEGYYGGYTRLFPPPDSKFKAMTGFDDGPFILEEHHRTVATGYVGLYAGDQQQLQFKWTPNIRPSQPNRYRLRVQRQPGAPEHTLNVVVKLPLGYRATEVSPQPISTSARKITWQTVLDRDQIFSLQLVADSNMPTVVMPTTIISTTSVTGSTAAALTGSNARTFSRPVAPAPIPEPFRAPLPVWLSIPVIGVGAPVVPVGLEPSGIMASPTEADLAGWYELGPRPGEPSNAVIAAHINWKGEEGIFARLHEIQPGDTIEVQNGPNSGFNYVVESIETYEANSAPVAEIFGSTPGQPILTLITCAGPYDYRRQEYRDRLVVRARGLD